MPNKPQILKIGIIGPRPFGLGGHDTANPIRSNINTKIRDILAQKQKEYPLTVGKTGLNIGVEQDFAQICLDLQIDYDVYLPYPSMTARWEQLPSIVKDYEFLLSKALNVTTLSEGQYSPKKVWIKNAHIIKESDFVIYVNNVLKKKCELLDMLKSLKKEYVII